MWCASLNSILLVAYINEKKNKSEKRTIHSACQQNWKNKQGACRGGAFRVNLNIFQLARKRYEGGKRDNHIDFQWLYDNQLVYVEQTLWLAEWNIAAFLIMNIHKTKNKTKKKSKKNAHIHSNNRRTEWKMHNGTRHRGITVSLSLSLYFFRPCWPGPLQVFRYLTLFDHENYLHDAAQPFNGFRWAM